MHALWYHVTVWQLFRTNLIKHISEHYFRIYAIWEQYELKQFWSENYILTQGPSTRQGYNNNI